MDRRDHTVFTASECLDVDCFLALAMWLGNRAREFLLVRFDHLYLFQALVQHLHYDIFVRLLFIKRLVGVDGFGFDLRAWNTEKELLVARGRKNAEAVLRLRLFWHRETDTGVDIAIPYAEVGFSSGGIRAPDSTIFTVSTDL